MRKTSKVRKEEQSGEYSSWSDDEYPSDCDEYSSDCDKGCSPDCQKELKRQNCKILNLEDDVSRLNSELLKLTGTVTVLSEKVNLLSSVVRVLPNGDAVIGTEANPVDLIYTDQIGTASQPVQRLLTVNGIAGTFETKGICLDDATAALEPSFNNFPQSWLSNNTAATLAARTYHYYGDPLSGYNMTSWVKWFIANNIKVVIGITLADYTNELNKLSADYLLNKANFDKNTIAIAVGNEQNASQLGNMQAGITYARQLISEGKLPNCKVTTVLRAGDGWIDNTYPPANAVFSVNFLALNNSLDVICFNLYDGYGTTEAPLSVRLSWGDPLPSVTLNGFAAFRFAMQKASINKEFWCTEVGWETQSVSNTGASLENAKNFYTKFSSFNTTVPYVAEQAPQATLPPNRIFYFTIRNTNGETFGTYNSGTPLVGKW